jgi:hypothetical protein
MSDRQLALWDIRAVREPINGFKTLDSISGVCKLKVSDIAVTTGYQ